MWSVIFNLATWLIGIASSPAARIAYKAAGTIIQSIPDGCMDYTLKLVREASGQSWTSSEKRQYVLSGILSKYEGIGETVARTVIQFAYDTVTKGNDG